jgi:hypothetical protein
MEHCFQPIKDIKTHYDEFKLNIRRAIVYSIVAGFLLYMNDPVLQLSDSDNNSFVKPNFGQIFNEFSIIAFLAFDRVGKVIFELLFKRKNADEIKGRVP